MEDDLWAQLLTQAKPCPRLYRCLVDLRQSGGRLEVDGGHVHLVDGLPRDSLELAAVSGSILACLAELARRWEVAA